MQDPREAELETIAARAVGAVAHGEVRDAAVPAFLLRYYLGTDRGDLREALGVALTTALETAATDVTVIGRAAWLTLLVEATAVSDDERMRPAVAALVAGLRAGWKASIRIDDVSASVEACLRAADVLGPVPLVQDAIDQLEHVVGGSYRPGDGLVRERGGVGLRCSLADHVRGASALLAAFDVTGRLPYSMLAEELMAIATRELSSDAGMVIQCEAARVLCRLAALHDDPAYRGAAVVASGADYRADASGTLSAQSSRARAGSAADAAAYGLALLDVLK